MSLRAAINAFCRHCLYSPDEPGRWREQITACTSYKCPLYPVRPVTKEAKTATLVVVVQADLPEDDSQPTPAPAGAGELAA